jgi:hypothetical protein
MPTRGSDNVVVRDTRPLRALHVFMLAFYGVVLVWWTIERPLIGLPLLLAWIVLLVVPRGSRTSGTVATTEGIAGLRVRVPRTPRAPWFRRHDVVASVTPWNQIGSVTVGTPAASLSRIVVRLTDGRDADLGASAITRRGLRKIAADLERLRPPAA